MSVAVAKLLRERGGFQKLPLALISHRSLLSLQHSSLPSLPPVCRRRQIANLNCVGDDVCDDLGSASKVFAELFQRVVSLEPLLKRIEVGLRKTSGTKALQFDAGNSCSLHVEELISGRVKRIESYGLFITIDQSKLVGLVSLSSKRIILTTLNQITKFQDLKGIQKKPNVGANQSCGDHERLGKENQIGRARKNIVSIRLVANVICIEEKL